MSKKSRTNPFPETRFVKIMCGLFISLAILTRFIDVNRLPPNIDNMEIARIFLIIFSVLGLSSMIGTVAFLICACYSSGIKIVVNIIPKWLKLPRFYFAVLNYNLTIVTVTLIWTIFIMLYYGYFNILWIIVYPVTKLCWGAIIFYLWLKYE